MRVACSGQIRTNGLILALPHSFCTCTCNCTDNHWMYILNVTELVIRHLTIYPWLSPYLLLTQLPCPKPQCMPDGTISAACPFLMLKCFIRAACPPLVAPCSANQLVLSCASGSWGPWREILGVLLRRGPACRRQSRRPLQDRAASPLQYWAGQKHQYL